MSETLTNGVIVPDKGSRDWYADLRSNWLKLDSLMAGGNITINPAQTDGILVATITVGGREYKLYQQDGDVSVKIDPSTENAEYPLVASTSAEANTGSVVMAPAVTVNPSTGAVTATSFKGKLEGNASTATTATKAVQDGAGAVIADTYATKSELNTKANNADVVHKSGTETIVGTKTFSDVTYSNKELRYKDTKYDWTNTSLDTWCDAGHVAWFDKTGNRRMHEMVGTKGGVWRKACYINEKPYFNVDSDGYIAYWGYITFHGGAWFNGDSFLKMTDLESNTTTPTSAQYKNINVIANNGSQIGNIQFSKRADGRFDTTIYSHGGSGDNNNGSLRIASNNEVYPLNNKTKLGTTGLKWSEVWANTFNGNLVSSQINVSNNSSLLRILGGTSASTGANLDLYGENESKSGGDFVLRARKSSGYKALIGKINGTLTWDDKTVLTDANQIMLAKNLTGANVTPGGVVDCGNGNGLLVGWYMNTAGAWVLANNKPKGKWKNANCYNLLAEESGVFLKVG